MANMVEVEKVTIACDHCTFETEDEPENWHNKPCPMCGAPNIIDDADMEALQDIMDSIESINAIGNQFIDDDVEGMLNKKAISVTFSSNAIKRKS